MICESTSLNKYLSKSSNIFFVFGSEIVLKNNSVDQIDSFLKEQNFTEKKIITEAVGSSKNKTLGSWDKAFAISTLRFIPPDNSRNLLSFLSHNESSFNNFSV